jgi:uncharacterized RDD family membrane protein YckC
MSNTEPRRVGVSFDVKPHAYDPAIQPEYFDGVLSRRVLALVIDVIIITMPVVFAAMFIFLFGIVTLGLGWLLFWLLPAGATIWAILYYGLTFGSPKSATIGMRMMDIEMRTWYGAPCYFLLGAVHAVLYWISVSALTPLILLVAPYTARRRLLHYLAAATIVKNTAPRGASWGGAPPAAGR